MWNPTLKGVGNLQWKVRTKVIKGIEVSDQSPESDQSPYKCL